MITDKVNESTEQTDKREDKIFNNSYQHGENLKGDEYHFG